MKNPMPRLKSITHSVTKAAWEMVPWQDEDHAHQISAALDHLLKEANQKQPKDYRLQRWIEKMKRTGLKMDPVQRSSLPWMHNAVLCSHDHMKMPLGVWLCSAQCEKVGFYEGGDLSPDGGEKPWGWHLLEVLLSMGMDTELKDPAGRTMLIAFASSIRCDFREAVSEKLIKAGADVNAVDHEGFSALHYALEKKHDQHASYLLGCGKITPETINTQTRRLRLSPLMLASSGGDLKVVKELLRQGAHVHLEDETQRTALHYATITENIKAIGALLAAGADIEGNVMGAKRSEFTGSAEEPQKSKGIEENRASRGSEADEEVDESRELPWEPFEVPWEALKLPRGASGSEGGQGLQKNRGQTPTPLLSALRGQHYQSAKYLLEQGANVSFSDGDYSALEHLGMMLHWPQNHEIARELIESLAKGHQIRNLRIRLTEKDQQEGQAMGVSESMTPINRIEPQDHRLLLLKIQEELQEKEGARSALKSPSKPLSVTEEVGTPTKAMGETKREWAWWESDPLEKSNSNRKDEGPGELSTPTSHLSLKRGRRVGL